MYTLTITATHNGSEVTFLHGALAGGASPAIAAELVGSHLRSLQQMLDGYQANMKTGVDLTELAFAFAAIPADHERLIVQEVK